MVDLDELGARVRVRRNAAGWSQGELATRAGLVQKHVSNVERADGRPSIVTVAAIARALNVSIDSLVWGQ